VAFSIGSRGPSIPLARVHPAPHTLPVWPKESTTRARQDAAGWPRDLRWGIGMGLGVAFATLALGVLMGMLLSGCTIERFFVLNETVNYPAPQATP